jgi:antibiotic biosynthesis monooxygenase (ABM) superfamily enzyme
MSTITHSQADSSHVQATAPAPVGPPTRPQMAVMIWLAVFPTLTVLSLVLGPWLSDANPVLRTFVLATVAVPTIVFGEMPWLQRARVWLLTRRG